MSGSPSATSSAHPLKARFRAGMERIITARDAELEGALAGLYTPDAEWRGSLPFDELSGVNAITETFWKPLKRAMPDVERNDMIMISGEYEGRTYIATMGHYVGTFVADLAGVPANGRILYLRYGEVHQFENGSIVQSTVLVDMLDALRQAGHWPVAPSLGTEGMWPAPDYGDGLMLDMQDPAIGDASLTLVRAMQMGLGNFDGKGLTSMGQSAYWHPNMMWYGPSGIGTTRALKGFQDYHQIPFLEAFPDRKGSGHYIRVGEGNFAVTGGWPSVRATHTGGTWLGIGATGKPIGMRVMDFYRCEGNLIKQNWVPIDVLDILRQMGVDVFARLAVSRKGLA